MHINTCSELSATLKIFFMWILVLVLDIIYKSYKRLWDWYWLISTVILIELEIWDVLLLGNSGIEILKKYFYRYIFYRDFGSDQSRSGSDSLEL